MMPQMFTQGDLGGGAGGGGVGDMLIVSMACCHKWHVGSVLHAHLSLAKLGGGGGEC